MPVAILDAPLDIAKKGHRYVRAWMAWVASGSPTRTEEDIARNRTICAACKLNVDGWCGHPKCGCKVSGGWWLGDKVAWATEHCPDGKW